ncbi:MAG: alpha/beta hydrolase [Pseudomonadota bacterium]
MKKALLKATLMWIGMALAVSTWGADSIGSNSDAPTQVASASLESDQEAFLKWWLSRGKGAFAAPASPLTGSFTVAPSAPELETQSFTVAENGDFVWTYFSSLSETPGTPIVVTGTFDSEGKASVTVGDIQYDLFSQNDDAIIIDITTPDGLFTWFGGREGSTIHAMTGDYTPLNDAKGTETNRLLVGPTGDVLWDFVGQGFPFTLEGQLQPDNTVLWEDFLGFDIKIAFGVPSYGHFYIEIQPIGGSPAGYSFGAMSFLATNPYYLGLYTPGGPVSGFDSFSSSYFFADNAGNYTWRYSAMPSGSGAPSTGVSTREHSGTLVDNFDAFTDATLGLDFQIEALGSGVFLISIFDGNDGITLLGQLPGVRQSDTTSSFAGVFELEDVPGVTTKTLSVDADGVIRWVFWNAVPASGDLFTVGGGLDGNGEVTDGSFLPAFNFEFSMQGSDHGTLAITASPEPAVDYAFTRLNAPPPVPAPVPKDVIGKMGGAACEALELGDAPDTSPFALQDPTGDTFYGDLVYGPGVRQRLDLFLPSASAPTSLLIYIHGGGFVGGDKSNYYENDGELINGWLSNGIAVASINYTFLGANDSVIDSLTSSARALQYLRCHSSKFNIDPNRVVLSGGSAGAGTSLWLGNHDDVALLGNADPVLEQSTRVLATAPGGTQATYDILDWEIFLLPALTEFVTTGQINSTDPEDWVGGQIFGFYGAASYSELLAEPYLSYRENVDMLALMDANDAPFCVGNGGPASIDFNDFPSWDNLHDPLHAKALRDRALEVGLEHRAYADGYFFTYSDPSGENCFDFMMRYLQ